MSSSKRKRRRISPSSEQLPNSAIFDQTLFRRHVACFLLCDRTRKQKYRSDVPKQIQGYSISELMSLSPTDDLNDTVDKWVHLCTNGIDQLPSRRSAGGYGNTENRPMTGRELVAEFLKYHLVSRLKWFWHEYGQLDSFGLSGNAMSRVGKDALVVALVEVFHAGTHPQARRSEEGRVLEQMDFSRNRLVTWCQITVPLEVFLQVIEFRGYDYELIVSVGLVNWNHFILLLSSWAGKIRLHQGNLMSIPLVVCQRMRTAVFSGDTYRRVHGGFVRQKMLIRKELQHAFELLPRDQLECLRLESMDRASVYRCFQFFGRNFRKKGSFVRLRVLKLPSVSDVAPKKGIQYKMSDLAPNIETFEKPFEVSLCRGLTKLRSLTLTRRRVLEMEADDDLSVLLRQLHELHVLPSYPLLGTEFLDFVKKYLMENQQLSSLICPVFQNPEMFGLLIDALNQNGRNLERLQIGFMKESSNAGIGMSSELDGRLHELPFLEESLASLKRLTFGTVYTTYGFLPLSIQTSLVGPIISQLSELTVRTSADGFGSQPSLQREQDSRFLLGYVRSFQKFRIVALHAELTVRNRGLRVFYKRSDYVNSRVATCLSDLRWILKSPLVRFLRVTVTSIVAGDFESLCEECDRMVAGFQLVRAEVWNRSRCPSADWRRKGES